MKIVILSLIITSLAGCTLTSLNATPTQILKPGAGAPVIGGTPVILPTPVSSPIASLAPVDGNGIRNLMLTSHTRWQNLWGDGMILFYGQDGSNTPVQTMRIQLWISQPGKTRVLLGDAGGAPVEQTASDGAYIAGADGIIQPIADYILQPFLPPSTVTDTITPHPAANLLNSPMSDLVYPTALAQRGGEYTITGTETFLDRQVYLVEWRRETNGPLIDRFWVDASIGILLRQQNFGKPGGQSLNSDLYFNTILFEPDFSEETFYLGLPLPAAFAENLLDLPAEKP